MRVTFNLSRTFQVLASQLPVPSLLPIVHYTLGDHFCFDLNWAAIHAGLYVVYYLTLEPVAAVRIVSYLLRPIVLADRIYQLLYAPQLAVSVLTATAYSKSSDHVFNAAILHIASWVAQFLGHGLAEGRAPALVDNLIGGMKTNIQLLYHYV
jgi:uncharacterized membrane protein YGL010W